MNGLIMDYPLTIHTIFRRAETLSGSREIVTRRVDGSIHRYCVAEFSTRVRRLATALRLLGIQPGDRVATLGWNHYQHLEAYFGIPLSGGVLHTLNVRLLPDDLAYIINHADDRVVLVDECLWPLWERVRPQVRVAKTIVMQAGAERSRERFEAEDYESLIDGSDAIGGVADPDERTAAAMCYTTGTTGKPKGVLYSHRAIMLHTLGLALPDSMGICERDVMLPVVPMFHANAWGMPFAAMLVGAKIVLPGPRLDPISLLDLFVRERVTMTGGVPTVWMAMLQHLDENPGRYDLSSMRAMFVGGSAAPPAMIDGFEKRHGLEIVHAWGMTEMCPVGTMGHVPAAMAAVVDGRDADRLRYRAKQGRAVPLVEIRARNENGLVEWNGETMGELEVRGAWILSEYYNCPEASDRFTSDGWFKTGDVVTIDADGTIQIQDRAKDLIKSGGEWISSVALECALMGHPAVAEAAVVPVRNARWGERPLAAVVLKPGAAASPADLREFLAPQFPKFWLPDTFEFIEAIPRTSAGKFKKSELRDRFNRAHE